MTRHDTHHRFTRADGASTVRSSQAHTFIFHETTHVAFNSHHVLSRDAVSHTNTEFNTRFSGVHNRICCKWWRYKYGAGLSTRGFNGLFDGIKYRQTKMLLATFTWRYTTNDVSAVVDHFLSVKCSYFSSKTLNNDWRFFV